MRLSTRGRRSHTCAVWTAGHSVSRNHIYSLGQWHTVMPCFLHMFPAPAGDSEAITTVAAEGGIGTQMCDQGNGDIGDPAEDLHCERVVADTRKGRYGICVMSPPCDTMYGTGEAPLRGTGTQTSLANRNCRMKSCPESDRRPHVHCEPCKWLEFVLK